MAAEPDTVICYGGVGGFRIDEVADAVSLHLNYLWVAESLKVARPSLDLIGEVVIEEADQSTMPSPIYRDFSELSATDRPLALRFQKKFTRQLVLAGILSDPYEKLHSKIEVIEGPYSEDQRRTSRYYIQEIRGNKERYLETIKSLGVTFDLESRIKKILEQVITPPLTDLSLGQARLTADLRKGFDDASSRFDRLEELIKNQGQKNGPPQTPTT